jgi:hypothetical protein
LILFAGSIWSIGDDKVKRSYTLTCSCNIEKKTVLFVFYFTDVQLCFASNSLCCVAHIQVHIASISYRPVCTSIDQLSILDKLQLLAWSLIIHCVSSSIYAILLNNNSILMFVLVHFQNIWMMTWDLIYKSNEKVMY